MRKEQIFIVEDEGILALNIQENLEEMGYRVAGIASTGKDAIKLVNNCKPDLILMDIILDGDMDGITTAAEIGSNCDIPIIYLTAHSDEKTLNRAKATKPYAYVLKPFTKEDLYSNIELSLYRHKMEKKLHISEEKWRTLVQNIPDIIMNITRDGTVLAINRSFSGLSMVDVIGGSIYDYIPAENHDAVKNAIEHVYEAGVPDSYVASWPDSHGSENAWYETRVIPIKLDKEVLAITLISTDITTRKKAEEELIKSEDKFRNLVNNIKEYIYSVEYNDGKIESTYHSPRCRDITGYTPDDYESNPDLWMDMIYPEDGERVAEFISDLRQHKGTNTIENRIVHKDGSVRWVLNTCTIQADSKDEIVRETGFIIDITHQKHVEKKLIDLATHDILTRLPNRSVFIERSTNILARSKRHSQFAAVLFIDLDGFKSINDKYGHDCGDILLKDVANRLLDCVREVDVVSRRSGDEFTIMLESVQDVDDLTTVAQRILDEIAKPYKIGNAEETVTASIGISEYPGDGSDIETLLKKADKSMYYVKKKGKNNFRFFSG